MEGIPYRGYFIRPKSQQMGPGEWVPEVRIISGQGGKGAYSDIYPESKATYPTRQEADEQAIALAKQWIDQHG